MYRLANLHKVRDCRADFSELGLATQKVARNLAMCLPKGQEVQRETAELLQPQDQELRARHFLDPNYAIIEILWAFLHERHQDHISVQELTKLVNALLYSRGETLRYSAEEVGWRLTDLHIPRHRSSAGQQVVFNRENSLTIHRWARTYEFPDSRFAECQDCKTDQVVDSKSMLVM